MCVSVCVGGGVTRADEVSAKRTHFLPKSKTTDSGKCRPASAGAVWKSRENLVALGAARLINKAGFP